MGNGHRREAKTRREIVNVTGSEESSMAITRPEGGASLVLVAGRGDSSSRARKRMAAATRQTTLVGRSVLVPTILLVEPQIVAGAKRSVKNQSMGEIMLARRIRRAGGTMEAKSAAIRKPAKR